MKQKLLSILLAVALLLSLPVTAFAAETTCDTLKHTYDDGVCTTCGHSVIGSTWLKPNFPDGDYTIVAMPDPQWLVDYNPHLFSKLVQWIVDNEETLNIKGVMILGDMTDDNTTAQWTASKAGMDILDTTDIPWMPMMGNHDNATSFNTYYDYETYGSSRSWFGGSYHEDKLDHTYWYITAGKREYIVFSLGWAPSWDVVAWMEEIIQANPDKNIIYTAHAYMYSNGELINASTSGSVNSYGARYAGYPEGEDINKVLSKYDNFVLGIGGHIMYADLSTCVTKNPRGMDVWNLLMDAQNKDTKTSAYAMLGIYTFHNGTDDVEVSWYSTWFDALYKQSNQIAITVPHLHVHDYIPVVYPANCVREGYTRYICETCHNSYKDNYTDSLGDHSPAAAVRENNIPATKEAAGSYDSVVYCSVCKAELSREAVTVPALDYTATRIYGSNRSETAIAAADTLKTELGIADFNHILLAGGTNFADALAGSYLAAVKDAPILLHTDRAVQDNLNYILENLSVRGTVYILGGTAAVPQSVEDMLTAAGVTVKRLYGSDRFATNIEILKEAGVTADRELLVCTGYNFADSLSASATGLPILLVNSNKNVLTDAQQAYLTELGGNPMTIIGGTGAVSEKLEGALGSYGQVGRVYGDNRYETSVMIAKVYFDSPHTVCIAYGQNFPDGLCGGPLAFVSGAPLLLTESGKESYAAAYVAEQGILAGYVMGGTGVISDETVAKVFG